MSEMKTGPPNDWSVVTYLLRWCEYWLVDWGNKMTLKHSSIYPYWSNPFTDLSIVSFLHFFIHSFLYFSFFHLKSFLFFIFNFIFNSLFEKFENVFFDNPSSPFLNTFSLAYYTSWFTRTNTLDTKYRVESLSLSNMYPWQLQATDKLNANTPYAF